MDKVFQCPKCGVVDEQEYDDCIDEEEYDGEIFKKYCGSCRTCGASLVWWEKYKFVGYSKVKVAKY